MKSLVEELREVADSSAEDFIERIKALGYPMLNNVFETIADRIEREYIECPRFEDGEPVKKGDTIKTDEGKNFKVLSYSVRDDGKTVFYGEPLFGYAINTGERVKRAEPEVLDADGVPIHVGDTVYLFGGVKKHKVTDVGYEHHRFAPDTDVKIIAEGELAPSCVQSSFLTHKKPDSLERIKNDSLKSYGDYWECMGVECSDCPSKINGKTPTEHYVAEDCSHAACLDLIERTVRVMKACNE